VPRAVLVATSDVVLLDPQAVKSTTATAQQNGPPILAILPPAIARAATR
jgi:hypothetical protein